MHVLIIEIRSEYICKKGDEVDYYGLFLHGQAFISLDHQKLRTLSIGDMIGFMLVSELNVKDTKHKYDIIAETDGVIAVFPFGEFKSESRKNPQAVCSFSGFTFLDLQNP